MEFLWSGGDRSECRSGVAGDGGGYAGHGLAQRFEASDPLIVGLAHLADIVLSHKLAGWRTRLTSGWADAPASL